MTTPNFDDVGNYRGSHETDVRVLFKQHDQDPEQHGALVKDLVDLVMLNRRDDAEFGYEVGMVAGVMLSLSEQKEFLFNLLDSDTLDDYRKVHRPADNETEDAP